ncbi:MAG: exodeoxyribonuclease small subunit [Patescibacteria group bacterium]|nr:exodeoxyribonuclease small subunit [Patescibacteria group bacterium]
MSSKNKSIQEKTIELNKLVEWFDSSDFTLELALDKFKQAEKLAIDIESDLSSLKNEIQVIKQKFSKEP